MAPSPRSDSGTHVPLKLTASQRTLILDELKCLGRRLARAVEAVPMGRPARFTPRQLDDLAQCLAAELVLTKDRRLRRRFDRLYDKIAKLREQQPSRRPAQKELAVLPAPALAPYGVAEDPEADELPILPVLRAFTRPKCGLRLTPGDRQSLIHAARLQPAVKQRLAEAPHGTQFLEFCRQELCRMHGIVERAVPRAASPHKKRLQGVLEQIAEVIELQP